MPISKHTLDFLFENKLNNSKEWFHAHKEQYQKVVLEPLGELVMLLEPAIRKIDPDIPVIPKPTKSISRIYRDTRFSKNKSLYRDNMWIIFIRDKKLYDGLPAFYADFSANGMEYGVGYYKASTESMRTYREMIQNREPSFQKALAAMQSQNEFSFYGERYKRSKAPEEPEEIRNWLDRKSIGVSAQCRDFDLIFSDRLHLYLAERYQKLKPVYDFFMAVEARRARDGEQ